MNVKQHPGGFRSEALIRRQGLKLKSVSVVFIMIAGCCADQMKNGHYLLNFGLNPRSKERLPIAQLELRIDDDSVFIYDTVMGVVDSRKNDKKTIIKYQDQQFQIKINVDTISWIGDSLTWVWVKIK